MISVSNGRKSTPAVAGSFPGTAACIVAGRKNRFSAGTAATTGDPLESNRRAILLAFGGLSGPAFAQTKDKAPNADRPLLATFCDAADIKGSACSRAKGYRGGKRCDVKLTPDRTSGKFLADGRTLLVVNYESGCEPHATNFGGAVIFEQKDGATVFRGYQPGFQANDCISLARNEKQDRLICITGHLGQGPSRIRRRRNGVHAGFLR
jgi:hypothetical protein